MRFRPCKPLTAALQKWAFSHMGRNRHTPYARSSSPDRAPLKEVLGGQYTYREGEGKCCGRAFIKAAG